jgi:glycosyltransferase involved in cell wall biosynthesis
LKEATALGQAGFDVTVVTLANIERFEAYDRDLMRDAPFRKLALDRVSGRIAARAANAAERAMGRVSRSAIRFGIEMPSSLGPFRAMRRLVTANPADLTILHTEMPFLLGPALLSRGRKVAADFEDWHSRDLLPSAQAARPLRTIRAAERFLMRNSAYASAPSLAMAQALHAEYGGTMPITLPNSFPLQPEPGTIPRNARPSFFWFSQTIGEGRGLEPFLRAWSLCRTESSVCLLGDVSPEFRQALLGLVPKERRDRVQFLPLTSPGELPGVIARHDIGLALEPKLPESRFLTATNKIFQYLNAGLAVVATPTAGQQEILSRIPGAGLLADLGDAASLARNLDALVGDIPALSAMGRRARQGAAEHYSWELAAPRLVSAVADAISARSPR